MRRGRRAPMLGRRPFDVNVTLPQAAPPPLPPASASERFPLPHLEAIRNSDALYWFAMTTPHGESPAGIVLTTLFVAASMMAMSFDGPFAV